MFFVYSIFFFRNRIFFGITLSHKTQLLIYYYLPTHLKRQTDVLREKMDIEAVPYFGTYQKVIPKNIPGYLI